MWPGLLGGRLESPVKVEAAKGISYYRPMLGAVNLLSKGVYSVHSPATKGKGLQRYVLHRRLSVNFQCPVRVRPLASLLLFSLDPSYRTVRPYVRVSGPCRHAKPHRLRMLYPDLPSCQLNVV